MQIVYSGQTNKLVMKAVKKADGDPIESGTVNFYVKASTGDDAGKWYRGSDGTWQGAEALAGAGAPSKDGDWELELASSVWTSHVAYRVYIVESGDLHVPNAQDLLCAAYGGSIISGSGPVTRAVVKNHLKVPTSMTVDDDLIDGLILFATGWCEDFLDRTFVNRSRQMVFDRFPKIIRPYGSPLVSVESLKYIDSAGDQQTLSSALYQIDLVSEPGRIMPAYGQIWPTIRPVLNAVELNYTAGYGAGGDVPDPFKQAVQLLVGFYYWNRDGRGAQYVSFAKIPDAVFALLWPGRVF